MTDRPCPCGSRLPVRDLNDARGILVARVCDRCENSKRLQYRNEIFTDPNYWADERIKEPVPFVRPSTTPLRVDARDPASAAATRPGADRCSHG